MQSQRTSSNHLLECVKAIALCHNVSPVTEDLQSHDQDTHDGSLDSEQEEVVLYSKSETSRRISYQASSPDEVSMLLLSVILIDWQYLYITVVEVIRYSTYSVCTLPVFIEDNCIHTTLTGPLGVGREWRSMYLHMCSHDDTACYVMIQQPMVYITEKILDKLYSV